MRPSKIIGLTIAFILLTTFCADAQWRYGVSLGGSFAAPSLNKAPAHEVTHGSGFRGGLTLEYQSPKSGLAFDASVLYHRYSYTVKDKVDATQCRPGRDFIDIPLNVKYKFWLSGTNNLLAPTVETGPAVMVHAGSGDKSDVIKIRRVLPMWNFAIGLDAANIIQLKAGYRLGLTEALHRFDPEPDAELKLNGFFITANILFDF